MQTLCVLCSFLLSMWLQRCSAGAWAARLPRANVEEADLAVDVLRAGQAQQRARVAHAQQLQEVRLQLQAHKHEGSLPIIERPWRQTFVDGCLASVQS